MGGGGCGCFFNDTATTEIYTLSLHDARPSYPKISAKVGFPLQIAKIAERTSRLLWMMGMGGGCQKKKLTFTFKTLIPYSPVTF